MNVASLELCKELYELSEWDNEQYFDVKHGDIIAVDDYRRTDGDIPAYDLGYLLRKLPKFARVGHLDDKYWRAHYDLSTTDHTDHITAEADTPEDAVAKLAIGMLKQGVLTKGNSNE